MFPLYSLINVPVLDGLTKADLNALSAIAQERLCDRGERLITRGEIVSHLYIVRDGRFALTVMLNLKGRGIETVLERKDKGAALGWSAPLPPRKSIYSAYCVWPGTLIELEREALQALLAKDSGLGFRFMRNITQLVGSRAQVLQDLWREEVAQSSVRVKHWIQREVRFDGEDEAQRSLEAGVRL